MKNSITNEQRKQIVQLVDQSISKGIVAQAVDQSLPEESKTEFQRIMEERLLSEVKQVETKAGIVRDYTHLGAKDFIQEQSQNLQKVLCEQGKLKNTYSKVLNMGGEELRKVIVGLIEIIVPALAPHYQTPALALPLVLILIRMGLDNFCGNSIYQPD